MATPNDGGPAFPRPFIAIYSTIVSTEHTVGTGMTLRDYFAAKAMQAYAIRLTSATTEIGISEGGESYPPGVAKWAYTLADAMLAERERRPQSTGE